MAKPKNTSHDRDKTKTKAVLPTFEKANTKSKITAVAIKPEQNVTLKCVLTQIDENGKFTDNCIAVIEYTTVRNNKRTAELTLADIYDKRNITKKLTGVLITDKKEFYLNVDQIVSQIAEFKPIPFVQLGGWVKYKKQLYYTFASNPEGQLIKCILPDAAKITTFTVKGTLGGVKQAAKTARHSSSMMLMISAALASAILKLLDLSSFGIILSGLSSKGKTKTLKAAAFCIGAYGNRGLISLASTKNALREEFLGRNDWTFIADDTSSADGDMKQIESIIRIIAMDALNGPSRGRANSYEAQINALTANTKVVALLSSEDDFKNRRRGEEARLMQLRFSDLGSDDIFDGARANDFIGMTVEERERTVDKTDLVFSENEGVLFKEYINRLETDPNAIAFLKEALEEFRRHASKVISESSHARIGMNIAACYAAAIFAIHHDLLPWKVEETRNAFLKCLEAILVNIKRNQSTTLSLTPFSRVSDVELLADFKDKYSSFKFAVRNRNNSALIKNTVKIVDADVIKLIPKDKKKALHYFMRSQAFHGLYPHPADKSRVLRILEAKGILVREGEDTSMNTTMPFINPKTEKIGSKSQRFFKLNASKINAL